MVNREEEERWRGEQAAFTAPDSPTARRQAAVLWPRPADAWFDPEWRQVHALSLPLPPRRVQQPCGREAGGSDAIPTILQQARGGRIEQSSVDLAAFAAAFAGGGTTKNGIHRVIVC